MSDSTAADWRPEDRAGFFESILDSLKNPIVFCDLEDVMQYMNAAAEITYAKWGGRKILGKSVLDCHNPASRTMIAEIKERFLNEPELEEVLITDDDEHRIWMRAVREEGRLTGYYERYERPRDN